jgi:hypothetical protein
MRLQRSPVLQSHLQSKIQQLPLGEAVLDEQGNRKGYFTKHDFVLRLAELPNQDADFHQAELTLYKLLQEDKVGEIESEVYRLKEKLNHTQKAGVE